MIKIDDNAKLAWNSPELTVYGSIEDITAQIPKRVGPDDGLVFITNAPITIGS